ncbi:MAG TPA: glycosyltransferase family 4 protein [Vicinamibacterales bacterium]|nr:glycosyltransferase family 4 protein [Vicinamibacterales bacterium]
MARVLVLTLLFPPDGVSTAQIVGDLVIDLAAQGHDLTVFTTTPHYNRDVVAETSQPLQNWWGPVLRRSSFHGVPVYHVRVPRKGRSVVMRLVAWTVFHAVSTLASFAYGKGAQLIFAPSPPLTIGLNAWLIGRIKRCPFIYNVQEIYPDIAISLGALRNRALIRLAFLLERFVYSRAAAITVIAPRMRERLLTKGVPERKLRVIPNSVDLAQMSPQPRDNAFAREFGLLDRFVVSYAGNLGPAQGLETVLDAAAQLQTTDGPLIVFIGGGILEAALRVGIADSHLMNVRLLPHQPYARVPEIYAASDICLVPQAAGTGSEAIPSKIYRIMACGKPVIASADARSDLAQLINESGCGGVVPPQDSAALVSKIKEALEHPQRWAAKGAAGRAYVDLHYSRTTVARIYEALITAVARSD